MTTLSLTVTEDGLRLPRRLFKQAGEVEVIERDDYLLGVNRGGLAALHCYLALHLLGLFTVKRYAFCVRFAFQALIMIIAYLPDQGQRINCLRVHNTRPEPKYPPRCASFSGLKYTPLWATLHLPYD